MKLSKHFAFTLIELLIVVAIIAILAAIAVPNFLEAQTRAKVSRARADQRTIATGLESYYTDNNSYPYQNAQFRALRITDTRPPVLESLTTPIAYLSSIASVYDPFKSTKINRNATLSETVPVPTTPAEQIALKVYTYYARNAETAAVGGDTPPDPKPSWYAIGSAGPDLSVDNLNDPLTTGFPNDDAPARAFYNDKTMYDPTNGTVSPGGIYRVGGAPIGKGIGFYRVASGK